MSTYNKENVYDVPDGNSSRFQEDILSISRHFTNVLLQNPLAVQQALRQCTGVDGTYNMCSVVDHLVTVSAIRNSLQQISDHAKLSKIPPAVTADAYGTKLIHFMLSKEKYFSPFRRSYYLLYQSFPLNPRRSLAVIIQRYKVPDGLEAQLLLQSSCRVCNQGVLNYLLIELRRDRNLLKFWDTVKAVIEEWELKKVVEKYETCHLYTGDQQLSYSKQQSYDDVDVEGLCCLLEAAPSAIPVENSLISHHTGVPIPSQKRRCLRVCSTGHKGFRTHQQKRDVNTRLVDGDQFSYANITEACLPTQQAKLQPETTRQGVGGKCEDPRPFIYTIFNSHRKLKPNNTMLHVSFIPAVVVLENYYHQLLATFPGDYMTSLEKICQVYADSPFSSSTIEFLTAPTTAMAVNQRILDWLLSSLLTLIDHIKITNLLLVLQAVVGSDNLELSRNFQIDVQAAMAKDDSASATSLLQRANSSGSSMENSTLSTEPHLPHHSMTRSSSYDSTYHKESVSPQTVTRATSFDNAGYTDNIQPGTKQWMGKHEDHHQTVAPNSSSYERHCWNESLYELDPKILAILTKYYEKLWRSFPKDHMISLERCCTVYSLKDSTIDYITSAQTSDIANIRLLDYMTVAIAPKIKESLFLFCNNLEVVIGSIATSKKSVIEELQKELLETMVEISNAAADPMLNTTQDTSGHIPPLTKEQPLSLVIDGISSGSIADDTFFGMPEFDALVSLMMKMPKNYKKTVREIKPFLTDDEVSTVMASPDYMTANERIITIVLSYSTEHSDLLSLCEILESVTDAPEFTMILKTFRRNWYLKMKSPSHISSAINTSNDASQPLNQDDPVVLSVLQLQPTIYELLKKHYNSIWTSFPQDLEVTIGNIVKYCGKSSEYSLQYFRQAPDLLSANQRVLDMLIIVSFKSNSSTKGPLTFITVITAIIGDSTFARNLRKDFLDALNAGPLAQGILDAMDNQLALKQSMSAYNKQPTGAKHPPGAKQPPVATSSGLKATVMYTEEDQDACLSAFDHCYDLMLKVNPRFAKKKFEEAFDFPNGDPLTGNLLFQSSEIQMEVLLVYARNSITSNGVDAFFKLVNMLCSQEPYSQIGVYLLDAYHTKGGHGIPVRVPAEFNKSVENLMEKLEYHNRQLSQYGVHYQPPKPLPSYYITRPKLLNEMTKALMGSKHDDEYDVDLVVEGSLGFGKTTIAKGLCSKQEIMQYFLDGFLWITLGMHPVKPAAKLSQIYYQLTATTITGSQDFLVLKLKNLVAHLRWLLVIIDDVWQSNDVKVYLEAFGCCKVILLSWPGKLKSLISAKHWLEIGFMDPSECIDLLYKKESLDVFGNNHFTQISGLMHDLYYSPMLLNLIRCQISVYCIKHRLPAGDALQRVVDKLHRIRGSINDTNDCSATEKAVIEASLQLLEDEYVARLSSLVLYTRSFYDIVIYKQLLPQIWEVSEEVADKSVVALCSLGLLQYTEQLFSTETTCSTLPSIEIHANIAVHMHVKADLRGFLTTDGTSV